MRVIVARNPFEPETFEEFEVDDLLEFLKEEIGDWPETARLYWQSVSTDCDVTPVDEQGADRLKDLDGPFFVVIYPGGIAIPLWVVAIGIVAVSVGLYLLMPKVPNIALRNTQAESPNNSLSERTNQARVAQRIPDIYGQVRATPDLIALPYKIFIDNIEYEYCYMCLGRGQYEIHDVRDDTTPFAEIEGSQLELYGPNTSPISGDQPFARIGPPITEYLVNTYRNSAVNGQTLEPAETGAGPGPWVGPFTIDLVDLKQVWCNFVALNGMYKDNGTDDPIAAFVQIQVEITPVDKQGNAIGGTLQYLAWVSGAANDTKSKATTLRAFDFPFEGRATVRARRITPKDTSFEGQVVDEVKWRDMYGITFLNVDKFGDVTTVVTLTKATEGALAVKERKLNMLVTRKLPMRIGDGFSDGVVPTTNAADIMCAIALDPKIGNRPITDLDLDNIYDTVQEVQDYFGTANVTKFQYTFDKSNISFEETLTTIADAVFCTPYRRGHKIQLAFEKRTEDSVLLFNHRNKVPGSEVRTIRFGYLQDNDGVVYKYVSPIDDSLVELYIPAGQEAINPKSVESIGVRSPSQAWFHANRIWNKIRYQNKQIEFTGLAEAELLVRNDRILVANNTRSDTIDGEVTYQNVLELGLSQPFVRDAGDELNHIIFLQHFDGTVESIPLVNQLSPTSVVLSHAPALSLSLGDDNYRNTLYHIVRADSPEKEAFLLQDRTPQSNTTSQITAINYDNRYYMSDRDIIDGWIEDDPDPNDSGGGGSPVEYMDWTDLIGRYNSNTSTNTVTIQGESGFTLKVVPQYELQRYELRCMRRRPSTENQFYEVAKLGISDTEKSFAVEPGDLVYFQCNLPPGPYPWTVTMNIEVRNGDTEQLLDIFLFQVSYP